VLALIENRGKSELRSGAQGPGLDRLRSALGFLVAFGLAQAIAVARDLDDGGVVREAVDEPDGAGGVGEDRVALAKGGIGGKHDGLLFVATRDDLEEEVGGAGIVGQVADLGDAQELWASVGGRSRRSRPRAVS
jgi:hypothetical protein